MKAKNIPHILLSLVLLSLVGASIEPAASIVRVRECQVRAEPSFFGKPVRSLKYGDRVRIDGERGGWCNVSGYELAVSGWTHSSAFASCRFLLTSAGENVATNAASREITIGGKGFAEDDMKMVEAGYRGRRRELDYSFVDRMEKSRIAESDLESFIRKGDLFAAPGGAR